jgi:sugar phosphate isomerase/epimerase
LRSGRRGSRRRHPLGAPFANTYFGWRRVRADEAAIQAYRSAVLPLLALAEENSVTVTIENEFDCFGHDPAGSDPTRRPQGACELVASVDHPRFRLALDPCNAYFAGCEAFPAFVEMVWTHVAYVHVKDGRRLLDGATADPSWVEFHDEGRRYSTCALGEGAVNWPGLFRYLRRQGYNGYLTVEPHSTSPFLESAWSQAVRTCRLWIEEARQ